MAKRIARTMFVKMYHAKTKAEGLVPRSAVARYEKNGWKTKAADLREAEKTEAQEAAKADETAEADSKKNTPA